MQHKLIFDVGFHKGEDTVYYLKQGYNVVGIEANPILVDSANKKFSKELASKQLQLLNIGMAKEEGKLPFYINQHLSEWSSFEKALGCRMNTPFKQVEVACKKLSTLFDEFGVPHYLKIDIEGYDSICLETIVGYNHYPRYISCEASSPDCFDLLIQMGYTQFKLINQFRDFKALNISIEKNHLLTYLQNKKNRIKLRLQNFLPFKHIFGSSGPFGEDTDGYWYSADEIKEKYYQFFDKVSGKALNGFSWFDIHAKQ